MNIEAYDAESLRKFVRFIRCMYGTKELDCIRDVHNLRNASIQYEAGKTILPLPLHLAKLLEQYFI